MTMASKMHLSWLSVLCFFVPTAAWAQAQPPKQTKTARELFYAAVDSPSASESAETTANRPKTKPANSGPKAEAGGLSVSQATLDDRSESQANRAKVLAAAYTPSPLGLRYSIRKKVGNEVIELSPDSTFHSGDRIQLGVQINSSGYLYIIQRGSSGQWTPMFPSAAIQNVDNRVESGRTYVIPPKGNFYFNDQPGEEKLFIIVSRQLEPDMERMIGLLRDGDGEAPRPEAGHTPEGRVTLASNATKADDSAIDRLRTAYARDLVIQQVDDGAPDGKKDTAVYVVNPKGDADARVVADIRLIHR
jgi:hypothetical protein